MTLNHSAPAVSGAMEIDARKSRDMRRDRYTPAVTEYKQFQLVSSIARLIRHPVAAVCNERSYTQSQLNSGLENGLLRAR